MYVRRKRRFVRRKGSSGGGTDLLLALIPKVGGRVATVALVAVVAVALPATLITLTPLQVPLFHVDPSIQESLITGKPVCVFVVAESGADIGLPRLSAWRFGDVEIVKTKLSSVQQLHSLVRREGVISVYAWRKFRNSPLYYIDPSQYPFREFDADNRLHEAYGNWMGRNVTVAIIDTGIDYTHPDFYDGCNRSVIKVLATMFYISSATHQYLFWEPYKNGTMEDLLELDMQLWEQYGEPAFLDINGHGTHCAGIVAGRGWASNGTYRGIAPSTYLVVVKAFDRNGQASMDFCLSALEWVYNNTEKYGIKVLSLSWGAAFASDGTDPMSVAVDKIAEKGVLVFAAAGNEGNIPTTVVVPAVARGAFAVGAWDPYYDKVAPFSSLGPTVDLRMKPDFMGAGVMVVSCRSRYVNYPDEYRVGEYYVALSGTSMSTPAVAGVAADFIEYFRYWHHRDPSAQDFIQWELANGRHISFVKDFLTGWGIPVAPHT